AIKHSRSVGLDRAAYQALGVLWVVRRHDIEYLGAAFDADALVATTWVASLRGATSLRRTLFHRGAEPTPLVRAETTWALVDAATGRPRRIPREVLGRYGFEA
ncbi:MAG: acyl-CoA thioesterase, partial [Deltaproteobacteria bacterium]|nr:acyl-CoA thioesterase [Deltaproteobacteria bacterium]